jgi:hypothetical protein
MRKTFLRSALIGMAVALSLTRYAYYSNLHQDAPRLSDLVYLLLCPPSIGLMATENASVPGQAFIVTVVVVLNGVLYGAIGLGLRKLFTRR